jgi:hypothetical protein
MKKYKLLFFSIYGCLNIGSVVLIALNSCSNQSSLKLIKQECQDISSSHDFASRIELSIKLYFNLNVLSVDNDVSSCISKPVISFKTITFDLSSDNESNFYSTEILNNIHFDKLVASVEMTFSIYENSYKYYYNGDFRA